MKDYVSAALDKIYNKNHKKLISKELQAHIDDRTEYYISAGYDEETARIKANDDMGEDAETVGQQLNFIHANYSFLNIVFALLNVALLFYVFIFVFFSWEYEDNAGIFFNLMGYRHFYILSAFVIIMLAELYVALKLKLMFTTVCIVLNFIIYGFTTGYVPTMFALYKLLKGELQSYANFTAFYHVKLENEGVVSIMSGAFVAVCILLSLLSLYVVFRFLMMKYRHKTVRIESRLKSMILILLFFVSAIFGCACFALERVGDDTAPLFNGVYVIESDEPVNPESIKDYDINYLYVHDDWGDVHMHYDEQTFYSENGESEAIEESESYEFFIEGETDVSCKVEKAYAEFKPTKKYVMVVPVFDVQDKNGDYITEADFDKGEWLDTSKEHTVVLDDCKFYGIVYKTTIKTHKR